jgi:hypothetical protein
MDEMDGQRLQFAPLQLQTDALQVHVPDVSHMIVHVLPSHVHVLESEHVSMQFPVVDWHCAMHVSEPVHVRLHPPTVAAEQLRFFVPPPQPSKAALAMMMSAKRPKRTAVVETKKRCNRRFFPELPFVCQGSARCRKVDA